MQQGSALVKPLAVFFVVLAAALAHANPAQPIYDPIEASRAAEKYADDDVIQVATRNVELPFRMAPDPKIATVLLLVSEDRGRTWRLVTEVKPGVGNLEFQADRDGVFWLAVHVSRNAPTSRIFYYDDGTINLTFKIRIKTP